MELDLKATSRGSPTVSHHTHLTALDTANATLFSGEPVDQHDLRTASGCLVRVAEGGLNATGSRTRAMYTHEAVAYYYNDFLQYTDTTRYPRFLPVLTAGYFQTNDTILTPGYLLTIASKIGDKKPFEKKVKEVIQTLYLNGRARMLETAVASMIVTY